VTDETRARFLAAIAAQLPAERIAEVHLFPAIRQGGMESGVAVVAVEPMRDLDAGAETQVEHETDSRLATDAEAPTTGAADDTDLLEACASESLDDDIESLDEDDGESLGEDDSESVVADAPPAPAPRRYTVFSARYRHTLKGPDRGKWETSVVEEADAPLLTVDAVVRGVQRRSGDVDEIVRMSGDEVRATLPVSG
jgi:hypothetical protein